MHSRQQYCKHTPCEGCYKYNVYYYKYFELVLFSVGNNKTSVMTAIGLQNVCFIFAFITCIWAYLNSC